MRREPREGRPHRNSHLHSPPCQQNPQQHLWHRSGSPSPNTPHARNLKSGGKQSELCSACYLCLGCNTHRIYDCNSPTLWDGPDSHLVNPKGLTLCLDWQRTIGCSSTTHKNSDHECSGCGSEEHGAQACPRGPKL
ncbi:hypothetical protein PAXRUDRAFT_156693 [Paxillus rubicundulus Ve08.2h10]|uniref:Uncharacterized protein n=1 Tax=Paxillus rubicundulus Ve08.2h10 TaxID=930991 RepID=A0A0D0DAZ8_9AGAM|nr:hypothetical protein PAXRUDRAFT_156693 [Paxillus rubicundulus Ve08.2h10]